MRIAVQVLLALSPPCTGERDQQHVRTYKFECSNNSKCREEASRRKVLYVTFPR